MDEKRLKNLKENIEKALAKKEFSSAFQEALKQLLTFVMASRDTLLTIHKKDFEKLESALSSSIEKLSKDTDNGVNETLDSVKKNMDALMTSMRFSHEAMVAEAEKKLDEVKDGEKGEKGDKGDTGKSVDSKEIARIIKDLLPTDLVKKEDLDILYEAIVKLEKKVDTNAGPRVINGGLISKRIRFIDDETPSGTVDGSNATFTLITKTPETGTLKVYVNGIRMRVTEDYTLAGRTITFLIAPPTGSIILADYRY